MPTNISNMTFSIVRNTANGDFTVEYDIDWSTFAQNTGLTYVEQVRLLGVDPLVNQVLWTGPRGVVSPNGSATTHRAFNDTVAWAALDEDPQGDDEIVAEVTLTPQLPVVVEARSNQVVVQAP